MVFLDHVQNLHIHAEKTHKDSGAHCIQVLITAYRPYLCTVCMSNCVYSTAVHVCSYM